MPRQVAVTTVTPEALYIMTTRLILTHAADGLAHGDGEGGRLFRVHKCARQNYIKDLR
jgi:hypothetical protein